MVTPPTTRTVAERVRAAMETAGKNPKSLAEDAGIPRTTLIRRLTGNSSFTLNEIDALAPQLGVTAAELLADESSVA